MEPLASFKIWALLINWCVIKIPLSDTVLIGGAKPV